MNVPIMICCFSNDLAPSPLDPTPEFVRHPQHFCRRRPLPDHSDRLLDLRDLAGAEDDAILVRQRRVVRDPANRVLQRRQTGLCGLDLRVESLHRAVQVLRPEDSLRNLAEWVVVAEARARVLVVDQFAG